MDIESDELWLRVYRPRLLDDLIDPAVWERPDMRAALGGRDIGAAYTILQRHGVSQWRIAALTGQAQSEVSEIIGGRRVQAYDLLVRIANGLGVPRGLMGLAYVEPDDGAESQLGS